MAVGIPCVCCCFLYGKCKEYHILKKKKKDVNWLENFGVDNQFLVDDMRGNKHEILESKWHIW